MAKFDLVSSKCVPLTAELAKEFNEMSPSPTERELDPRRIKHLREKAEAGMLVAFHWAKAKMNGDWLRMNGQHSSAMLVGLNGTFPPDLKCHLDEYKVDGPDGLALLFRQFDDRVSSRNAKDVAGAYQGLFEPVRDVPRPSAKLAIEGVTWYRRTVEGAPVPSGDDQYQQFKETGLHSFIRWIGDAFSIKTPELRKSYIVGAMYATFISNEDEARKFWEYVAKGGKDFDDNHPSTVLSCWYQRAKTKELKTPPKAAEYYQAGIYAWNAFRSENTITSIRIDAKKSWLAPSA